MRLNWKSCFTAPFKSAGNSTSSNSNAPGKSQVRKHESTGLQPRTPHSPSTGSPTEEASFTSRPRVTLRSLMDAEEQSSVRKIVAALDDTEIARVSEKALQPRADEPVDHPSAAAGVAVDASDIATVEGKSTVPDTPRTHLNSDMQSRQHLLVQVDQQLSSWIEGIDALTSNVQDGKKKVDMQGVIKRYFRPRSDCLLTTEVKMSTGAGDVFAGVHALAEQLEHTELLAHHALVMPALDGGVLVGSSLLLLAGAEGMKNGIEDTRRLKRLIKPLTNYRNVLAELQEELKNSADVSVAATELIAMNLQGVQARLRAAKHQLSDSVVELGISGMHATVGGLGIAEAATAIAGAATAAKAVGAAYGAAVAGFGAVTAAQSGLRINELDKLAKAVKQRLDEVDPLRQALLDLIKHERKTRKSEVVARSVLGAAGAASMSLEIAGLVGAVPTLGASLALTAAGVAMGAATAASFNPIKSRQRALNAVGGVERTTHMPATFLFEPGHLHQLLDKINEEDKVESAARRQILKSKWEKVKGVNVSKHLSRTQRALSKVIPSADNRALANKMLSSPQAAAEPSMKFMQQTTRLELKYLDEHKLPILQNEVEVLLAELEQAGSESSEVDSRKTDLLAQQLMVKAEACRATSARLEHLKDLDLQLSEFTKHMEDEFLLKEDLKQRWDNLQVDFIIAHDMVAEALSRNKLNRVQKQLAAQVDSDTDPQSDLLRNALRKNIDARFARIFAHSYPEKIGYEQRGAIEVARAMFIEEMENQSTHGNRNRHSARIASTFAAHSP